jgi:hypothetical protein
MLVAPDERTIISSMGWVDGGALWCFDVRSGRDRRLHFGDAKYCSLHEGERSLFAVAHHFDGNRFEITVHSFAAPEAVLSRCIVTADARRTEGDVAVWSGLPRNYVAYLRQSAWCDFALIRVALDGSVSLQTFEWYDERYDKGYQGIVGVTSIPDSHLVIVSVQRDSSPVIYDPETRRKTGALALAGNFGNPRLYFRRAAPELWADDYDTILKLDSKSWRVLKSTRIQRAAGATAQFIGQFVFDADERVCAVARPFTGDVVGLDPATLEMRYRVELAKQPLEVAILHDLRVFARDWKTGDLSTGMLRRH